jgi:deoxycytidine triphosphate deaminase
MILPDHEIERLARKGMITPFVPAQMTAGGMLSYGLSSFGYDARVVMILITATRLTLLLIQNILKISTRPLLKTT